MSWWIVLIACFFFWIIGILTPIFIAWIFYQESKIRILKELRESSKKSRWRCSSCGHIEYQEKEIICLKCGKGEMLHEVVKDYE